MPYGIARLHIALPEKYIYYVSWNLDACDGLGILQTDDAKAGRATIFTPNELLEDVKSFLEGIKAEGIDVKIENVSESMEHGKY